VLTIREIAKDIRKHERAVATTNFGDCAQLCFWLKSFTQHNGVYKAIRPWTIMTGQTLIITDIAE